MPFRENGFLNEEIFQTKNQIVAEHLPLFQLVYSLNKLAYKARDIINVHRNSPREIMFVCLLIRIHEGIEASAILLSLGLLNDAKVVLRSLVETYFHLKLVWKDDDYIFEYVKYSEYKNEKKIVKEINARSPLFQEHLEGLSSDEVHRHARAKDDLKQYYITIDKLAEKAGMKYWYDSIYYILSDIVHASSRAMECYLDLKDDKEFCGFVCGPRATGDFGMVVHLAADLLGHTLDSANKFFQLKLDPELNELASRSKTLAVELMAG
jgi:hypothetical protein